MSIALFVLSQIMCLDSDASLTVTLKITSLESLITWLYNGRILNLSIAIRGLFWRQISDNFCPDVIHLHSDYGGWLIHNNFLVEALKKSNLTCWTCLFNLLNFCDCDLDEQQRAWHLLLSSVKINKSCSFAVVFCE